MNKKVKIVLSILGLAILSVILFIAVGLYSMEIEDTYGDNQDFYYKSKQGDIVVNRDTKEFKRIEKTWKRIYGIHNSDTTDLWRWLHENGIEIYRPTTHLEDNGLSYEELDKLINEGKLTLIIKK
jgi:hypothetical protein